MNWPHNIYKQLVNDDTGLVGVVAYHLYKQDKIDWIETFHSREGREPTPDELATYFFPNKSSAQSISTYLERAELEVNRVLDLTIGEELKRLNRELEVQKQDYKRRLKDDAILTELRENKGFWHSVGVNMVAALLASGIIAAGSLFFWLQGKMNDERQRTALVQELRQELGLPQAPPPGKRTEQEKAP